VVSQTHNNKGNLKVKTNFDNVELAMNELIGPEETKPAEPSRIDAHGVQETLHDWACQTDQWAEEMLLFIDSRGFFKDRGLRSELEAQLAEKGTIDLKPDRQDTGAKSPFGPECDIRIAAVDKLYRSASQRRKANLQPTEAA
jgi:hypothetical protein